MPEEDLAGKRAERETAALYAIARLLAQRNRLSDVFEQVVEQMAGHVGLDFAALMVLDTEPDMDRVVGWYPGDAIEEPEGQVYRRTRARQMLADEFPDGVQWNLGETFGEAEQRMAEAGLVVAWSLPLMDGDSYYGSITIARREPEPFKVGETSFLRAAGELLAAAAKEEHAIWRAAREEARSQLLNELTILLNEGSTVEELFSAMAALLSRAVTFDGAGLLLVNEENALELVAADPPQLRDRLHELRVDVEIPEIKTAGRWLQFDPTESRGPIGSQLAAVGIRMACAVFLTHMGRTVGSLILSRESKRLFKDDDLAFLGMAATLLAQAIVNRAVVERELEESRAETAEQRALAAIAALSADERTPGRILDGFAATMGRFVPDATCAFAMMDGEGLTIYRSQGEPEMGDMSRLRELFRLTEQVTMSSIDNDLVGRYDWFGGRDVHAVSITPDRSAGSLRGVLIVASGRAGWKFGERESRLVRTAAQFVGSALHTAHSLQRLERGRAVLELVVSSLSAGIVLLDGAGKPAFVNAHGEEVMKALRSAAELDVPATGDDGMLDLVRAMTAGERAAGEAHIELSGESRPHRYEIQPMDHQSYSRLAIFEDIAEERRRAEEHERHQQQMAQAARLSALGELVGGVAHELNNPLTAILGFAEILMAIDGSEPMRDDLSLIHKEALRARNIVRDLLFLVRPGEVEREELSLNEVVGHIERLRRSAWRKQGIVATIEIAPEDLTFTGNEHQLTQVLLNLTTNAEQALAGTPDARLTLRAHFNGDLAVLEVEDNGPGMAAAIQERIWEPFYTTKPGIGTGLGLSLSRSIVQSHGGELTFETAPGAGARFRVEIPRRWIPEREMGQTDAAGDGSKWVLVVDDEPSLRKVAKRLVEALGHHCDVASTVEEATALAAECDYDLVLCDYRLATDVADDVVEGLQRVAPQLVSRIVIATGATTDAGLGTLARRYGIQVLPKPYGIEEISNLLRVAEEAA